MELSKKSTLRIDFEYNDIILLAEKNTTITKTGNNT
jgi:hypothetical protein